MKAEREGLLKDLCKLKTALHHLAARNQGTMLSTCCPTCPDACPLLAQVFCPLLAQMLALCWPRCLPFAGPDACPSLAQMLALCWPRCLPFAGPDACSLLSSHSLMHSCVGSLWRLDSLHTQRKEQKRKGKKKFAVRILYVEVVRDICVHTFIFANSNLMQAMCIGMASHLPR